MTEVRLLVVNGCSYTVGDELADPTSSAWPAHLGRALGVPVVNLAASGGSNRRLVRTTVHALERLASSSGLSPAQVLFVGMWTELSRFEFYVPARRTLRISANSEDGGVDRGWRKINPHGVRMNDAVARAYYGFLQDDVGDFINFLTDYILLESFLRDHDYRYAFALAGIFWPSKLPSGTEQLVAQIDSGHLLGDLEGSRSFRNLVKHRASFGKGRHPLEEAHGIFTYDHLFPWLRDNGLV